MKNLKQILGLLLVVSCSLILINCESENESTENQVYTYTSGKIDVLSSIKNSNLQNKSSSALNNIDVLTVEAVFTSNIEIPENLDEDGLTNFLDENKEKIIGSFTYKMNDLEIYSSEFIKGEEVNTSAKSSNYAKKGGDCSYEGVRQCTIAKIDALSDWGKVVCAFRRGCVLTKVASCTYEKCIKDDDK